MLATRNGTKPHMDDKKGKPVISTGSDPDATPTSKTSVGRYLEVHSYK